MPTCTDCANVRAASPLAVKIAVPLPNSCAFTRSSAASQGRARARRRARAEDLLAVDAHLRLHVVEQARAEVEALLVPGDAQPAAVDDELRAFLTPRST